MQPGGAKPAESSRERERVRVPIERNVSIVLSGATLEVARSLRCPIDWTNQALDAWLRSGERTIVREERRERERGLTPEDIERMPTPDAMVRLRTNAEAETEAEASDLVELAIDDVLLGTLRRRCFRQNGSTRKTLAHALDLYADRFIAFFRAGLPLRTNIDDEGSTGVQKTNALAGGLGPESVATNPVVPLVQKRTFRENLQSLGQVVESVASRVVTESEKVVPISRKLSVDIPYGSRPLISEVAKILLLHEEWMGVLASDSYRDNQIVKRRVPPWEGGKIGSWSTEDTASARAWFGDRYRAHVARDVMDDAIRIIASKQRFHSLADELTTAGAQWDGIKRIDTWLPKYYGAPSDRLTRAYGRKFLISAIARAMRPGCTVQHVFVLEGRTSLGKTRSFRALAGDEHYCDSPIDIASAMNAPILLAGVWFYVFDELAALDRGTTEQINQFVTLDRDEYVIKHRNEKSRVPRSCVLVGTTTKREWLASSDGARRWWPVRAEGVSNGRGQTRIDIDGLTRDRTQIFAEAFLAYQAGETWYLDDELETEAEKRRESRVAVNEYEEPISGYLAKNAHRFLYSGAFVTVSEIMVKALKLAPKEWPHHKKKIARVLTEQFGWQRGEGKIRTAAGRFFPYYPPDAEPEPEQTTAEPTESTPIAESAE